MPTYDEQIVRIKEKFAKAKMADKNLKEFGASNHKWIDIFYPRINTN